MLRKLKKRIYLIIFALSVFCSKKISYKNSCTKNSKRCSTDFYNKNYKHPQRGLNNPVCCSTHLYTIIKEVISVFEKENIEYYAVYGTFLGAIRHQGIIPWDTDIDIAVSLTEQKKILNLLEEKLKHPFCVTQVNDYLVRINYSLKNKVHADIYFWGRNDIEAIDYLYNQNIPLDELFPLKKRKFYNLEIHTPRTDYHLIGFYGDQYLNSAIKKYHSTEEVLIITDNAPAIINVEKFNI